MKGVTWQIRRLGKKWLYDPSSYDCVTGNFSKTIDTMFAYGSSNETPTIYSDYLFYLDGEFYLITSDSSIDATEEYENPAYRADWRITNVYKVEMKQ